MCLQDIKIGMNSNCVTVAIAATATAQLALAENVNRTALVLCPPSAGTTVFSFGQLPGTSLTGVRIAAGSSPVLLDIQHHGALLRVPVFVTMVAGVADVTLIESVWNGEVS